MRRCGLPKRGGRWADRYVDARDVERQDRETIGVTPRTARGLGTAPAERTEAVHEFAHSVRHRSTRCAGGNRRAVRERGRPCREGRPASGVARRRRWSALWRAPSGSSGRETHQAQQDDRLRVPPAHAWTIPCALGVPMTDSTVALTPGLIAGIDTWMMRQSCRHVVERSQRGVPNQRQGLGASALRPSLLGRTRRAAGVFPRPLVSVRSTRRGSCASFAPATIICSRRPQSCGSPIRRPMKATRH